MQNMQTRGSAESWRTPRNGACWTPFGETVQKVQRNTKRGAKFAESVIGVFRTQ